MEARNLQVQCSQEEIFPVVVIGSGAAGLTAGYELIRAGIPTVILEKERRLAEPWHRRHAQLHLNSHRDLSTLPGIDYPKNTPAFPDKNAVINHLNDFSKTYRLPVQFGVAVKGIVFKGNLWAVQTNTRTFSARHVIVATGRDQQPFIPDWKGANEFAGQIIHSADFAS